MGTTGHEPAATGGWPGRVRRRSRTRRPPGDPATTERYGERWRVRALRSGGAIELYASGDEGSIHHVEVQLGMLLHPAVRPLGPRTGMWWGAVALTAARLFEERLRDTAISVPSSVVVRRLDHVVVPLVLPDRRSLLVHEFIV